MKRVSVSVLVAVVALLRMTVPTAGAAERERHCYVRVVDRKPTGELVTSSPSCFDTTTQMEQAAHSPSRTSGATTQSTFTLATHYEDANFGGSSTSVVGSDCGGGWLNTS